MRTTLTIGGAQVEVSPATVVPNQSVTVTGRGFSGRDADTGNLATLDMILIGGTEVVPGKIDGGDTVEIDGGGNWVATIVIPVSAPATRAGTYEFKAVDTAGRPGVTQITVAPRTVSFTPKESRVGTTVTVSGTGWPATNNGEGADSIGIDAEYVLAGESSGNTSSASGNSNGEFTATVKVPLNAGIPSTNKVIVSYEDKGATPQTVSETVAHRVPGAGLEVTPSSGPGGTTVTITGGGFKAFTSLLEVFVGGSEVQPRPSGAIVGRDGVLEPAQILIPGFDPGTHTVKANIGGTVVSIPFTITADDAAPTTGAGDVPVADALQALIDNMVNGTPNLVDAYLFDDSTQTYLSYLTDPDFASLNDLETVKSGDILWIRVQESQMFAGKTLAVPWTQVVLP